MPSTFDGAAVGGTLDHSSLTPQPVRTSARTRKLATAFRLPVVVSESSTSESVTKSPPSNRKKSLVANPLHALLREKQLQDKRGTSSTALRLAEEAVREGSRGALVDPDDEDTDHQLRLTDEEAAWKAVNEFRKSASPVDRGEVDDFSNGDRASKMLGTAAGEAVNRILSSDKHSKGKEKAYDMDQKAALGVPLWMQPSDEDMEVDPMSTPPLSGHPILTCLDGFLRDGGKCPLSIQT